MSTESPQEILNRDIQTLQRDTNSLQAKARLADARDQLEDVETKVSGLPQRIRDLRARGYVFERELEDKASNFVNRWQGLRASAQQQIDQQASTLEPDLRAIEGQMAQLNAWASNPDVAQPLVNQLKASVSALENKVSAVERTVAGTYDAFKNELNTLSAQLDKVEWSQTQLSEASFQLLPSEGCVMAVKAAWYKQGKRGKDDPEGILFLTDQRLLFEQKQEIATKKVLFITTEKQKVQQLVFDAPIERVESALASKQGLMGHEDHIDVTFAAGAPVRAAHFHLNGQDSNIWQGLIRRAKAHDFDSGRVVPLDSAQTERVRSAPTRCPNCAGSINQTILRDMDSIKCEWCGTVIRL